MNFRAWGWWKKVGSFSGLGNLDMRRTHSQFLQLLAKLPGVWSDDADGVLADPQDSQHAQAVQPAFVDLSQVVVLQLSGRQRQEKVSSCFFFFLNESNQHVFFLMTRTDKFVKAINMTTGAPFKPLLTLNYNVFCEALLAGCQVCILFLCFSYLSLNQLSMFISTCLQNHF